MSKWPRHRRVTGAWNRRTPCIIRSSEQIGLRLYQWWVKRRPRSIAAFRKWRHEWWVSVVEVGTIRDRGGSRWVLHGLQWCCYYYFVSAFVSSWLFPADTMWISFSFESSSGIRCNIYGFVPPWGLSISENSCATLILVRLQPFQLISGRKRQVITNKTVSEV